ncbi:MAG: histidine--tRNA ligase [Candidatus Woesearchaeota archaeon]
MKKEFKVAKGVVDWSGKNALLRNQVRTTLQSIFERYGYTPLETPIIERIETLGFKGGGEIQKEVFQLSDQGNRDLALRFDHTVPLGRYMATESQMRLPFKRYAIGPVFRDGPTQPEQGRYRIFNQCDVDIIGVGEMSAEAEILALSRDVFRELQLGDVEIKINNRKLLDGVLDYASIPDKQKTPAIIALDKIDKVGYDGVEKELVSLDIPVRSVQKVMDAVKMRNTNTETLGYLNDLIDSDTGQEGIKEIQSLLEYSSAMNIPSVQFDPCLARGLDYYTGTTFEVYLNDRDIMKSAITAGGRFDNMVGDFCQDGKSYPAVGISFGLERLCVVLENYYQNLDITKTDIYLIPIDSMGKTMGFAQNLREQGLNVDLDLQGKKVGQGIRYADGLGIPYVGVIGQNEVESGTIQVKRLSDGKQDQMRLEDIYANIKRY